MLSSRIDAVSKKKFVLPFATPGENRVKDFTENMEMATIMCLAESGRDKVESHVLRRQDEKLVFIAEACYPIWLIPYEGATLIFDGLGLNLTTIPYDVVPETDAFNIALRAHSKTNETYITELARNVDYFRSFSRKEEIRIEGLMTSQSLMTDLATYLRQMKEAKKSLRAKIVLTPSVAKSEIRMSVRQLSNMKNRTLTDIKSLDESARLLNVTTKQRIKLIRNEIRKIQGKYDKQIADTKMKGLKKTWQIQSKYNRTFTGTSRKFRHKIRLLQKSQVRLQGSLRNLKAEAERIRKWQSKRRTTRRQRMRSEKRLRKIRKRTSTLKATIKVNHKNLRALESAQKIDIAKQKSECDERIRSVNGILQELQASKAAETTARRKEIAQIEKCTIHIITLMQKMVQVKKEFLHESEEIMLPRERQTYGLVFIPFYLARYEKEGKRRYVMFPPSSIEDMGLLTKMKGALGAAKMTALLQSRSKALTAFLNQVVPYIEKDPMIEKVVTEAGIRGSILMKKQLRIGVKRGLKQLEKEKWITKDEFQTFSKFLYIYA
jgi:hypothetical protein